MNTAFALLAQFETPTPKLEEVCGYFGLARDKAYQYAAENKLPVPTFRAADSQKAPRLVHVDDLAKWIDEQRAKATNDWERSQIRNAA